MKEYESNTITNSSCARNLDRSCYSSSCGSAICQDFQQLCKKKQSFAYCFGTTASRYRAKLKLTLCHTDGNIELLLGSSKTARLS